MSSITEWLQQQGPENVQHQGVTTLDIADLPLTLRTIARLILRETEMSYVELCDAVDASPDTEPISHPELDEALDALCSQCWLLCIHKGPTLLYKVNLRRRSGRAVSQSTWAALEED